MNILYAIDFDDTLNFAKKIEGHDYNPNHDVISFCKGKNFIVLTARKETESNIIYISNFLRDYGLPRVDIHFTDKGLKGPVIDMMLTHSDVDKVILVDDNQEQRNSVLAIENKNLLCFHPSEVFSIGSRIERTSKIKETFNKISKYLVFKQNKDYVNNSYDKDNISESSSEFTNELGNDIKIKAKKERRDGLEYYYLNLIIEGPTSVSENIITEMEAKELKNILNEII